MRRSTTPKQYLVGIPIPSLDRRGAPLGEKETQTFTRRTMDELTACFGGATPVPAPGTNVVQGEDGRMLTLFEQGQTLVLSACGSRDEFLRARTRIERFAARLADVCDRRPSSCWRSRRIRSWSKAEEQGVSVMDTGKVQVIEVVEDPALRKKELAASRAFRRFFGDAPPLKLYRTADGRLGFQVQLALASGDRQRFETAYRAVMKILGERRGRPAGPRRVQTKLRLKEPVYRALRSAARRSHRTVSDVVEDLAHRARLV